MSIGEKIKQIRELKSFTQEYVASKLGITQAGYSKIESGGTDITFSKIVEISNVLEVTPEDLIAFDSQKYFHSFNNVKGSNNGSITIQVESTELKKLYGDKIKILERLVEKTESELHRYKERFGDLF